MGDSECSFSISNLMCQEDRALLDDEDEEEEEDEEKSEVFLVLKDSEAEDDEYIESLVSREASFDGRGVDSLAGNESSLVVVVAGGDWLKCARSDAIQWMLRVSTDEPLPKVTIFICICIDSNGFMLWIRLRRAWDSAFKLLSWLSLILIASWLGEA